MAHSHQRGIALVALLIAMPVIWFAARGSWQIATATQDSIQQQRAVDRSAYSMAAKSAEVLNAIAINNQSIIGAHLLQGHLVTQMAWTRYAVQLTHRGSLAMGWAAPSAAASASAMAQRALQVQQIQFPIWSKSLELAAHGYALANRLALMQLATQLSQINQRSGAGLTQLRVDPTQLTAFKPQGFTGQVRAQALAEREWLHQRSWSQSFFGLMRLNKAGSSQESNGQWSASDQLTFKVRKWFKTKTITVAAGHASSSESGYQGPAALTALTREALWLGAVAGAQSASASVKPLQHSQVDQVLLAPVWHAELEARL